MDHVIPQVPVRHWELSLLNPLRVVLDAQPELVTQVLHVVQRVLTRQLLEAAELKAGPGHEQSVGLSNRGRPTQSTVGS